MKGKYLAKLMTMAMKENKRHNYIRHSK